MKIDNILKEIIKEEKSEYCIKRFGKILFADQLGGNEKNTKIENEYLIAINKFTDEYFGENINNEVKKAILDLKKCINTYPEVLKPKKEKVYRGINIKIGKILKNGDIPTFDKPIPYIYKASNVIQSWTNNLKIAKMFGDSEDINEYSDSLYNINDNLKDIFKDIENLYIPIVIQYDSDDDFLFKPEYLNKLSSFVDENELIRVGNRPIKVIAYLNDRWVTKKTNELLKIINKI